MKNKIGLEFGVGMLVLASFFFFACTKADDKVIASGYTEENNAQNNLDSVLAGILETWEVETATDSTRKQGTGANQDKFWYEVEFASTAKQLYAYDAGGEDSSASFVVSLYGKEKGLRLDMSTPEKTVSFTQVLSRDSMKAVAENRIDNVYSSVNAETLCRSDSVEFVNDCAAASGAMVDQFTDGVCSELHLVCVKRFTPDGAADDYLLATAQMLKKKYEEEMGLPGMDFFVDARDGRIYRSVEIGGTVWMAENLNYAYRQPTALWDSSSFCYDNDSANCDKYGRMYTRSAVMDSVGLFGDGGKGCGFGRACNPARTVRGVCPEGWRVPNYDEWTRLIELAGGSGTAGLHLKDAEHGGDDIFGLSLQPSGFHIEYEGTYKQKDTAGVFWTATEKSGKESYTYRFFGSYDYVGGDAISGYGSAPVRCVKGEAERVMYGAFDPLLVEKGTMTDPRDGRVYATVTVDGQTWMAENLAYDLGEGSLCFDNDPANCEKYGRMYTFYVVRDAPACPAGWHLPSKDEYEKFHTVTGRGFADKKTVTGWVDESGNGKDTYGFGLLPGGVCRYNKTDSTMNFAGAGEYAYLWTSSTTYTTLSTDSIAYSYSTEAEPPDVWTSLAFGHYSYVRCIMD